MVNLRKPREARSNTARHSDLQAESIDTLLEGAPEISGAAYTGATNVVGARNP
jgi:hypothetical protein